MFAKSYGAVTFGVDGRIIDVEVDVSYGFPAFDIVGLLDTAVKESRERVRTAIKNTGVKLKLARAVRFSLGQNGTASIGGEAPRIKRCRSAFE